MAHGDSDHWWWAVLRIVINERRPVRARYHDHERVLRPHALGWKNGRTKVLSYQSAGSTSDGALPRRPSRQMAVHVRR